MDTNAEDTIEENVSTAEEDTEEATEPLEKPSPAQKPRTQKQIAAFEKARAALAVKRANNKEFKEANKKPIGRPKKAAAVKEEVEGKPPKRRVAQGGRKQTMVYVDDSHSEESDDSEPESIVVRRRRKKRKPKKKKPQKRARDPTRRIRVTDSPLFNGKSYPPGSYSRNFLASELTSVPQDEWGLPIVEDRPFVAKKDRNKKKNKKYQIEKIISRKKSKTKDGFVYLYRVKFKGYKKPKGDQDYSVVRGTAALDEFLRQNPPKHQ